jgi:hypothetical protein
VIASYSRYGRIPLKYHTNIKFYTQYTHPTLICRGTDTQTDARTNARRDNIYSIFRDKLLLLGEHVLNPTVNPELILEQIVEKGMRVDVKLCGLAECKC